VVTESYATLANRISYTFGFQGTSLLMRLVRLPWSRCTMPKPRYCQVYAIAGGVNSKIPLTDSIKKFKMPPILRIAIIMIKKNFLLLGNYSGQPQGIAHKNIFGTRQKNISCRGMPIWLP